MRVVRWIGRGVAGVVGLVVLLLLASALSNLGLRDESRVVDRLSDEEAARLAETFHLRHQLGDRLWPGWGSMTLPQIVYNERYAFLLGYPGDPPAGWYREPAHELVGGAWYEVPDHRFRGRRYHRQELREGRTPQAFTVRVGDRWVGSIMTLEAARIELRNQIAGQLPPGIRAVPPYRLIGRLFFRGPEHHVSLTLHEAFHAFQGATAPEAFAAAESAVSLEDDYPSSAETTEAWRREVGLLADAIEAPDSAATATVRAFLDHRAARRRTLDPELREYEQRREWLEGLAKYTELEIWMLADTAASYRPLPDTAAAAGIDGYDGAADAVERELAQLRRSAGQGGSLFYYSGMAQAMLLDRLADGWKPEALPGGRPLDELLAEALERTRD